MSFFPHDPLNPGRSDRHVEGWVKERFVTVGDLTARYILNLYLPPCNPEPNAQRLYSITTQHLQAVDPKTDRLISGTPLPKGPRCSRHRFRDGIQHMVLYCNVMYGVCQEDSNGA
jgi:hypothetical protein